MDQKFILAANLQEKLKLIETQDRKLPQQELENLYKLINTDVNGYQILEAALEKNFGGLLPDKISYSIDYNENVFKKVIQSLEDFQLIGLYVKYIEQNCRSESVRTLYKLIGFETERFIRKCRQQGSLDQKLNIQKEIVVEMISKLCPSYVNYNPELFHLMLKAFQKANNIQLLNELADSLLKQCEDLTSLNDQHDWLILLSTIFELSYQQKTLGICILIEKIGKNQLLNIIERNWNYLFINYFNDPNTSVLIFQGLIRFSLLEESITIIISISDQLKDQMQNQKSQKCFKVLEAIYDEVIIAQILPNLHMHNSIFELLLLYMVGLADVKSLSESSIDLICDRLNLILDLRQLRDQYNQIFQFTHILIFHYPDRLRKHEQFNKIHQICKERSEQSLSLTYDKWNLDFEKENQITYLDRETQNYVGLENLTNTCYMNSILQSLYMTQSFRQFVLLSPQIQSNQFSKLQKLFMLLNFQVSGFCSPYELKRTLRAPYGNSNDQQDVSEFAHHFLEDLLHELPKEKKQILENIFYGTHRSIIQCYNDCPKVFGQNEKFLGLDLHFNEDNDLSSMIRKLYEEENIEFTCEKCNIKSNRITKSQQILQFPSVLFMTIQRFKYDVAQQSMTKILTKVPMKFELDMREVFGQPQLDCYDSQYILYAFIVHLGKNSYSGHYICYARSMTNPENWITFDDTQISKQEWSSLQLDTNLIDEETPYLLFYQNKSGSPLVFNN